MSMVWKLRVIQLQSGVCLRDDHQQSTLAACPQMHKLIGKNDEKTNSCQPSLSEHLTKLCHPTATFVSFHYQQKIRRGSRHRSYALDLFIALLCIIYYCVYVSAFFYQQERRRNKDKGYQFDSVNNFTIDCSSDVTSQQLKIKLVVLLSLQRGCKAS